MTQTEAQAPKYEVISIARNHYVANVITHEFIGVAFTSRKKAQAKADEKNAAAK